MAQVTQHVSYTLRRWRKAPWLTLAAVVSIALGIAANTTVFSIVSAVALNGPPVGDPGSLVSLHATRRGGQGHMWTWPLFVDVREQSRSFSSLAAYFPLQPFAVSGSGAVERTFGKLVSAAYFDTARVAMAAGRGFRPEEENEHVVVLSHALWQRRFGGDPGVVGRGVTLSSRRFTVVGVAGPGFRGIDNMLNSDLWVPLGLAEKLMPMGLNRNQRTSHWLMAIGRLKPGVSRQEAQAELDGLAARIAKAHPKENEGQGFSQTRAGELMPGPRQAVYAFLAALLAVVLLVLAIACANVANLLLSQASARQREMAVRLAMGATRRQLLAQLLTESTMLALAGGVGGALFALACTRALSTFQLPIPLPIGFNFTVNASVLAWTFGLSVGSGLLFGLAPALLATRPALSSALKGEDILAGAGRRITLSNALVFAQVTASMVLLCATGLFLRSLQSAASVDIGFRRQGVVLLSVDPLLQGYEAARARLFFEQATERLAALPGVEGVALSDSVPLSLAGSSSTILVEGEAADAQRSGRDADLYKVSQGYFSVMEIPLKAGRLFAQRDTATATPVAVVNESFVRKVLGGGNPIGRRVSPGKESYEIVGVVGDIKSRSLGEEPAPVLFSLLSQDSGRVSSFIGYAFHIRSNLPGGMVLAAARRKLSAMDPNLVVFDERTIEGHLKKALFLPQLAGALFGVFGGTGLLLAIVGLYGVMSYGVSRRTREIGIRMALGAHAGSVRTMVVRRGMIIAGAAMIVGLAIALASARLATAVLYGIKPHDIVAFSAVPCVLAAVAWLACWIPARRAARIEPMRALRYE